MTDGKTQLVGLIGWPVEHSLSPAMHNAAFDKLGLNWHYVPLPVQPGLLETAVRGLGALGFCGANVTVPHKQAVIPTLNSLTPKAKALGAVNTLVIGRGEDGSTTIGGYNSDDIGFVGALREAGFEPEDGGSSVIVGAGGAARAAIFGLLWSGLGEITVLNRSLARAQKLVTDLGNSEEQTLTGLPSFADRLRAFPLTEETLVESARVADLLVNATPVGMWPRVDDSIWPNRVPIPRHLTVFDMVYNPLETRLLHAVRRSGACPADGLGMLVRQGAIAFEMWTGEGPVDEIAAFMRPVCEQALGG